MRPSRSKARSLRAFCHLLPLPALTLGAALAVPTPATAQCFEQSLPATPTGNSALYGAALALQGDRLFVGASAVSIGGTTPKGQVSRLLRDPVTDIWSEVQLLAPLAGTGLALFGAELAVDGDRLFVGAPRDLTLGSDSGAVYVYEDSTLGGDWTLQQYIPFALESALFGTSIDADGDVMVVGAPGEPFAFIPFNGAAYIFRRDAVTFQWQQEQRLPATAVIAFQQFGDQVEIDGEFIAVSAPCFNSGRVDIYRYDALTGSWASNAIIMPAGLSTCSFGRAIALEDGWLAIGASDPLHPSPHAGHVKLYRYSAALDTWLLADQVAAPSRGYNYSFADTLAFDGDRLLVGATHGPSAYVYDLDVASGTLALRGTHAWTGPVSTTSAPIAPTVAIDGGTMVLGNERRDQAQVLGDQRCAEIGVRYCAPARLNSAGHGARIDAFGDTDLAAELFSLRALLVPNRQLGYFLGSLTPGNVVQPGGSDGVLCLGGHVLRFRAEQMLASYTGFYARSLDLSSLPTDPLSAVQPGETWYFQGWFRDGASSNFTDGIAVMFH